MIISIYSAILRGTKAGLTRLFPGTGVLIPWPSLGVQTLMARRGCKRKQTRGGGDVGVAPAKLRALDTGEGTAPAVDEVERPTRTASPPALGLTSSGTSGSLAAGLGTVLPVADLKDSQSIGSFSSKKSSAADSEHNKDKPRIANKTPVVHFTVKTDEPQRISADSEGSKNEPQTAEKTHGNKEDKPRTADKTPEAEQPASGRAESSSPDNDPSRDGSQRLDRTFYERSGEDLAKALLGQKIVRVVDGVRVSAVIVETEAYLGAVDKAAHSFKGQTDRNKAMFMPPGTAYVYNIYGMYCCLNISSQGEGCAVLIRSVEPKEGLEKMMELRTGKSSSKKPLQPRDLGNGPSKLCQSLGISKAEVNQRDLTTDRCTWLEKGDEVGADVRVVSKRINIAYAEEWTDKPLRFYTLGNKCVSVRDKEAEKTLQSQTTSRYFAG